MFTTKDVYGNIIGLSDFTGKKVLLTFYRNVGCPICNLRFHQLQQQAHTFKSKGLVVLAIYESQASNIKISGRPDTLCHAELNAVFRAGMQKAYKEISRILFPRSDLLLSHIMEQESITISILFRRK